MGNSVGPLVRGLIVRDRNVPSLIIPMSQNITAWYATMGHLTRKIVQLQAEGLNSGRVWACLAYEFHVGLFYQATPVAGHTPRLVQGPAKKRAKPTL